MKKTFGSHSVTSPFTPQAASVATPQIPLASETELAKREGILEERERLFSEKVDALGKKVDQVESFRKDLVSKLEKVSKLSPDEAKDILLANIEKDLSAEISKKVKEAEDETRAQADDRAKQILADAMLSGFYDYISEFTTSKVHLEDEDMKGKIIGKEGRNIRAFEQATGVDVLMDDEDPNSLTISCFDSVRREIAKTSIERLIADGRIQPQRIEEIVEKTTEDIEKIICQAGEKLVFDAGVFNLPREVVCMLGRFKYRFSFGQSLVQHSLELVRIGTELARQIGADVNVVRLGCLLHDIGKVVPDGDEGTHVEKGVQFAKTHGVPQAVITCIAEHHSTNHSTVEAVLVAIADAISGGRPGARHENVQDYVKRLTDIERIATSFDGVERAFAVQAGREVRVIVMPDRVTDDELPKLVHDIGETIQKEVMVPGAVKITAIRETRATESFLTSGV